MGKQLFITEKKSLSLQGHSCRDSNLEKKWISEYVSFRTVRDR